MTWKLALTCVGFGVLGVLITLVGVHLYTDHLRTDAIWNLELQRSAAAQQPPLTPPAPPPIGGK